MPFRLFPAIVTLVTLTRALQYTSDQVGYNLNENQTAIDPLDYWGEWADHVYQPSPANWRMPMYTFFVDRFVNGDPSNDDANGTQFEHDILSNQLRYGGDVKGLQDTLDYIQGMGVKLLYIVGAPWINMPWGADGYSPLDLTLLDRHHGDIEDWRNLISDIHRRDMYVIFDNTMATMGDLIGFEGYLNQSTPFAAGEHDVVWKSERRYHDFYQSDKELEKCEYPRFWDDKGHPVTNLSDFFVGCRDSEFDQYGEVASFGDYTEWQRQLSKFGFVQDRLREWRPSVLDKIKHFSCLTIASLDIDGYRIDKALQVTVDAQGDWSSYIRECARQYNKTNFYIPGEIVSGNSFGAIYIGRGMEPEMANTNLTDVVTINNATDREYIRDLDQSALDGAAFHYSIYRALTRFLGMDGIFDAEGDPPVNFVESWNAIMMTNDMSNAYTGEFDPRHMFGISNHDVFRWPGIKNGTEKNILGLYVITLLFPGIPTLLWGEEQAFYVLESTNANYVFGRPPMSSSRAWQLHGCYKVGSVKYTDFPLDSTAYGCDDDNISLDHRDPSHPVRNIIKRMFELRESYPALNDGYYLQQLSNHTYDVYLPGSNGTRTETGLWSVYRSAFSGVQDFTGIGEGNQNVWLVYTNENRTVDYHFDCSDNVSLVSPFIGGTTVKNLFAPYEEYTLKDGPYTLGIDGSIEPNGCLSEFSMPAWGYKALVPKDKFVQPRPALTALYPGHDYRKLSTIDNGETVSLKLGYSKEMDCDSISNSIQISSTVTAGKAANINLSSVSCSTIESVARWVGEPTTTFVYQADLENVHHGVHAVTVNNASANDGSFTNSVDRFMLRVGNFDNPMVFPGQANYSTSLLLKDEDGGLYLSHHAPGANLWRYTLNFGTTWSDWTAYTGGNSTLASKVWSGTKEQAWKGEHVIVQYWGQLAASSDHYQHGDLDWSISRRFPNFWIEGKFNQHGFDAGLANKMEISHNATWKINFQAEWPTDVSFNAWGINPDGQPDVTQVFGDIDGDNVLDRIPRLSLLTNSVNITDPPPSPFMAYRLELHDGSLRYQLIPVGSRWTQLILYLLLALLPLLTAVAAAFVYANSFYRIKFNEHGVSNVATSLPRLVLKKIQGFQRIDDDDTKESVAEKAKGNTTELLSRPSPTSRPSPITSTLDLPALYAPRSDTPTTFGATLHPSPIAAHAGAPNRRVVLIGTIEYDIEDWNIKVKIGGLGVMAQLMGKNLSHQDLIWVIPCVGDIDYPENPDEVAEPMAITILGQVYQVEVWTHKLRNITYVLLDAPVFRHQTKKDPYPPRMDDLESAVYYSAWNSCIAEAIKRYKPDLYHINDYHGCVAPLHLLPDTIPCALSLHNAEFQGLWPMRTKQEREEVCNIYNLRPEVVQQYVQFGEVFNLLHAGASYLRLHQNGFGAVGVSKKYGKRSYARYPIFWGLKDIGALPNPDPSDLAEIDQSKSESSSSTVAVDAEFEASRAGLRTEAQKWAGLDIDPSAELFVFVGRWSMQKGIDLIADIFPSVLEKHPKTQLICVGPVIDLYGTFAAIKLEKMMEVYPGRVFSRPEFTALPPFIFSGAEFALIPSRDEPFGLVAVEFGRKGALGVGARVGGLGQMPGWWYTIESTSTKHLLQQFKGAIEGALASRCETRAVLRARSSHQRFPVTQWVQDLDTLQRTAIVKHQKHGKKHMRNSHIFKNGSGASTPVVWSRSASRSRCLTPVVHSPARSRAASRGRSVRNGMEPLGTHDNPLVPQSVRLKGLRSLDSRWQLGQSPHRDDESDGESTASHNEPHFDLNWYTEGFREHEAGQGIQQHCSAVREDDYVRLALQTFLQDYPDGLLPPPNSQWSRRDTAPHLYGNQSPALSSGTVSAAATPPEGMSPRLMPLRPPSGQTRDFFQSLHTTASADELPRDSALLSSDNVIGEKKDFKLQKVDPFFTDSRQDYRQAFSRKLQDLNGRNTYDTVIEEFIEKSEKDWFNRLREVKMGKTNTPVGSIFRGKVGRTPTPSIYSVNTDLGRDDDPNSRGQFLLAENYEPPTGVKKFMLRRLGDWPMYSLLLAFGQVIAANSYQITLLTGAVGQSATKLYTVASIYLVTSILWWTLYRTMKSVWVLSLPFVFYGTAFFFIGVAPLVEGSHGKEWVQNVASACYTTASSSGSLFFALNFGDQGGSPVTTWVFRACVIQGIQQVYIAFLWCWGASLARLSQAGLAQSSAIVSQPAIVSSIGMAVAVLMWFLGSMLFIGLPDYYRQSPGTVPSFISSVLRRRIVLWFFMLVILQCFFLSAPYGRNWLYLWSSQHLPIWTVSVLIIVFFVGVWSALLYGVSIYSKSHSWLLPILAIGLVCPRWCQMLWGVSGIGQYVPWAGSPVGSAVAGRSLWLWLGVLDSLQNVGFGQILLHTLTRFHISFTLIVAQILGSLATIAARGIGPNNLGPGPVFPDFSFDILKGLSHAWFWVGLFAQILIVLVALRYFRKEQLSKP